MTGTAYLDGRVTVHAGDCLDVLKTLPDNSVDSCVTDPPYALISGGGASSVNPASRGQTASPYASKAGFMGMGWDTGDRAFSVEFWREVFRVLKPGGHMLAFGGTRTYHRLACAIEDAGFEIRDQIGWAFGSGFPKSHDVSKGIDKAAGAEREVVGVREDFAARANKQRVGVAWTGLDDGGFSNPQQVGQITAPVTEAARQWQGWGTALKPAHEPIVLARKPLSESTVAANVLKHGTGAINIDGCRVSADDGLNRARPPRTPNEILGGGRGTNLTASEHNSFGRWPANLIHDGSPEVLAAFPETTSGQLLTHHKRSGKAKLGTFDIRDRTGEECNFGGDSGSAARFFYMAKADSDDRLGSIHPTVKPVDLMQYLVRLVTPKGGTVLDPFAGTGTTGEAAIREGCKAVLIEREPEYLADIERRCSLVLAGPGTRLHATIKAKNKPEEPLPLFAEVQPQ